MTIKVEVAQPGDAHALADLHYLSHTVSFAPFVPDEWLQSRDVENYRQQWRDFLATVANHSRSRAWKVVDAGGKIVGTVRIQQKSDTEAQLNNMHVHPDHHRQGIGTLLMEAAVTFMQDVGYESATLGVIQANAPARILYERHGWEVDELLPTGVEGVPIAIYKLRL